MFELRQPQNPLNALAVGFGKAFVEGELGERQVMKKQQELQGLVKLNEDSSPLEVASKIAGSRYLSDPEKKLLMENYGEQLKTRGAANKKLMEEQEESVRKNSLRKAYNLTEEETEGMSASDIASYGKHQQKGGVTSRPVPPELGAKIKQVLAANPKATSEELTVAMDEAGVPRAWSNSYVETRRQQDERTQAREDVLEAEQAKADIGYQKTLPEMVKSLQHHKDVTSRFKELSKKGVTGKPYEKFLEKVGLINLTSEGRREAGSLQKEYTKDIKQTLGSQFSAQEFFTILNSYPSPDFSDAANQAIISNYEIWDDIKQHEIDVANQLLKENKGRPPRNFELEVANRTAEYAKTRVPEMRRNISQINKELQAKAPSGKVLMFDPEGEILHADPEDVERYQQLGATLP